MWWLVYVQGDVEPWLYEGGSWYAVRERARRKFGERVQGVYRYARDHARGLELWRIL